MLNCCCGSGSNCGDMSKPCTICAASEDVYVLSVYYMREFTFEILVDGVSIGFVYPKEGTQFDDCQAKYFIPDGSVIEEIKNSRCFVDGGLIRPACFPDPEFQVVDKDIFRKTIVNITIRPIPSDIKWWNWGMVFFLYRRSKKDGKVCTIVPEPVTGIFHHELYTYYYLQGKLSINVRQTICPTTTPPLVLP